MHPICTSQNHSIKVAHFFQESRYPNRVSAFLVSRRTRTDQNGTVRWTVPRRRLDDADTNEIYAADADFQRSVSFSILQIGELSGGLSAEYRQATATVDIPALLQFCEEQLSEK